VEYGVGVIIRMGPEIRYAFYSIMESHGLFNHTFSYQLRKFKSG
jgi:hypothetical protein